MCVYTHNPTTSKSKTIYGICVLLGKYTTYSGNSLPTPKARTDILSLHVGRNYHNKTRNFPEERISHQLRCGILKSWNRCVSAHYAPRTHRDKRVDNVLLFPSIPVCLVPLLLEDFSIFASEAFGGFKTFYTKNLWSVFCNKHLFFYYALAALHFIYSNQEKSHACHRFLWFLLFKVLCCVCWWLFTKQIESSAAGAKVLSVVLCSTVSVVSMANLLQHCSYRKSPIFWLQSEVLIITEALSPSAVRMERSAKIISALSAFLSVKYVCSGASSKYIILFWSNEV